jgi:hypothetical protein
VSLRSYCDFYYASISRRKFKFRMGTSHCTAAGICRNDCDGGDSSCDCSSRYCGEPSGPSASRKTYGRPVDAEDFDYLKCSERVQIYRQAGPSSRRASPAPARLVSFISAYLRDSTTPGAPALNDAITAAFTSAGCVRFSSAPVGISMSIPG